MRPAFLGDEGELFGCYYPARPALPVAVLVCPALLGEHVQQFRLLHLLAHQLAANGMPTLRFDWFGTGDSAGDLADTSTDRWIEDLATAASWLVRQSRCERLVLVGFRVGATLAGRYATTPAGVERVAALALWDPVVDGAEHLAQLRTTHHRNLGAYLPLDPGDELLGFQVPVALQEDLARLRLAGPGVPAYVTGVVPAELERAASLLGDDVTVAPAVAPAGWLAPEDGIYDVLVPARALEATVAWVRTLAESTSR
jgi:uncharacterized protein